MKNGEMKVVIAHNSPNSVLIFVMMANTEETDAAENCG